MLNKPMNCLLLVIAALVGGSLLASAAADKAHDQLHKWLMPFLGLSADYARAADPQVHKQEFGEIRRALLVFNEYFGMERSLMTHRLAASVSGVDYDATGSTIQRQKVSGC